jgi:hypothetical protein
MDEQGGDGSRRDRLASLRLSQTFACEHERSVLVLDLAEDVFESDYQSPLARLFKRDAESKGLDEQPARDQSEHPILDSRDV